MGAVGVIARVTSDGPARFPTMSNAPDVVRFAPPGSWTVTECGPVANSAATKSNSARPWPSRPHAERRELLAGLLAGHDDRRPEVQTAADRRHGLLVLGGEVVRRERHERRRSVRHDEWLGPVAGVAERGADADGVRPRGDVLRGRTSRASSRPAAARAASAARPRRCRVALPAGTPCPRGTGLARRRSRPRSGEIPSMLGSASTSRGSIRRRFVLGDLRLTVARNTPEPPPTTSSQSPSASTTTSGRIVLPALAATLLASTLPSGPRNVSDGLNAGLPRDVTAALTVLPGSAPNRNDRSATASSSSPSKRSRLGGVPATSRRTRAVARERGDRRSPDAGRVDRQPLDLRGLGRAPHVLAELRRPSVRLVQLKARLDVAGLAPLRFQDQLLTLDGGDRQHARLRPESRPARRGPPARARSPGAAPRAPPRRRPARGTARRASRQAATVDGRRTGLMGWTSSDWTAARIAPDRRLVCAPVRHRLDLVSCFRSRTLGRASGHEDRAGAQDVVVRQHRAHVLGQAAAGVEIPMNRASSRWNGPPYVSRTRIDSIVHPVLSKAWHR